MERVLDACREGVTAIRVTAGWYAMSAWRRPTPCEGWNAGNLAGHLECVARWYHEWLDRAEAGRSDPPFPAGELAARNASALDGLPPASGPVRIGRFADLALAYLARLREAWDLPYGFPHGTTTAGGHAALAAGEWHVHAWDLARTIQRDHRPGDAEVLLEGRRRAGLEAVDATDPWEALLRSTGRDPRWRP